MPIWYDIDKAEIEELRNKTISYIRIDTGTAPMDYEIKPKNGDLIKKEFDLIIVK